MTSLPIKLSRFLKLGISIITFILLPYEKLSSCFFATSEERGNYNFMLFQSNLAQAGNLEYFLYDVWDSWYYRNEIEATKMPADTAYYFTNVAEWQDEIGHTAQDKDVFDILYKTDPNIFKKNEKSLVNSNSFVKSVKQRPELWEYLKFAKKGEDYMSDVEWAWNEAKQANVISMNGDEMKNLVKVGLKMTEQSRSPFIKLRSAYLTMKLQNYLQDTLGVRNNFNKNFKNSTSKSWVVGSSYFYNAISYGDYVQRNVWYAQAFAKSIDKRQLVTQYFRSDGTEEFLKATSDKLTKANILILTALNKKSPQLENIKKVYQYDPQNKDLGILIHKEVNKMEDWLITPQVTDYKENEDHFFKPKSEDDYDIEPYQNEDESAESFQKRVEKYRATNRANDLKYCAQLVKFITKIAQEGKQSAIQPLLLMSVAHLNFIKKDWAGFDDFIQQVEAMPNTSKAIKTQIRLSKFVTWAARQQNFYDPSVQEQFLNFFDDLDKNQKDLPNYAKIRSQLALYCASEFIKRYEVAKGILMLSKTDRIWGDYAGFMVKNLYHQLLEVGKPKDYEEIINILQKTNKSRLERFLTSEPVPYTGNSDQYYDEKSDEWKTIKKDKKWDIDKIKEYLSMYYLRHDDIPKAYDAIKDLPESFWKQPIFESYMNVNAFHVNLRKPHSITAEDSIKFNKKQILKKILDLKIELQQDSMKYADNNLWLGNAYYNMSDIGNSWLMWDVWSGGATLNEPLIRAEQYFKKGLQTSQNPKVAAYCSVMANFCSRKGLRIDDLNNSYMNVFKKRFPNEAVLATNKYWCSEESDFENPPQEVKPVIVKPFEGIMPNGSWKLFFLSFMAAFTLISIFLKFRLYDR